MGETQQTAVKETLVDDEGGFYRVNASEVEDAKALGLREATLAQSIDAAKAEVAKGGTGQLIAGTTGALESATLGASNAALVNAFGNDADLAREAITRSQAEHQGTHLLGAAGGMFLNPLVSGAGGLAARAAGSVVGKGAASVGLRALQNAATIGAQGAVEGAFYGAGQQLSEDILGDHDITAEKLLAGAGKGALFGGVGGAALGAGGTLVAAGAKAAAGKVLGHAEGLAGWASEQANVQALKATGANKGAFKRFGETAGEIKETMNRLGGRLRDEGIVTATSSKAAIGERLTTRVDELGEKLGGMRGKLDETGEKFVTASLKDRAYREVVQPLLEHPSPDKRAAGLELKKYIDDTVENLGESAKFDDVFKVRHDLDAPGGKAKWNKLLPDPKTAEYQKLRNIIEDEFTLQGERASENVGEKFAAEYKNTKAAFSDLKRLRDITTDALAGQEANRAISLTDTMSGGNAALAGMMLTGNVGGAAFGLVGAAVNKGIREYGNQVASAVFDKMAGLKMLQKTVLDVDSVVAKGVGRIADGEKAPIRMPSKPATDVEKAIASVKVAANDTEATSNNIQRILGGAHNVAPKVAAAMAMTAGRAVQYLAANTPNGKTDGPSIQPFQQKPRYNRTELDQFAARIEGVENPMSILTDLSHGTISREKVDAVKNVYPQLFREMQQKIAIQVAASPKPLGWEQLKALAVVLGVPTTPTLQPQFVQRMQQSLSAQPQQQGGQSPSSPQPNGARRPVERYADNSGMTSADRIGQR